MKGFAVRTITLGIIVAVVAAVALGATSQPASQPKHLPPLASDGVISPGKTKGYLAEVTITHIIDGQRAMATFPFTMSGTDKATGEKWKATKQQAIMLKGWPTDAMKDKEKYHLDSDVKITGHDRSDLYGVYYIVEPVTPPAKAPQSRPAKP